MFVVCCSNWPDRRVCHCIDIAVMGTRRLSQGSAILTAKQSQHDVRRHRDAVLLAPLHDQRTCRGDGAVRVDIRPLGVHPGRHPLDDHARVDTSAADAVLQVALPGVLLRHRHGLGVHILLREPDRRAHAPTLLVLLRCRVHREHDHDPRLVHVRGNHEHVVRPSSPHRRLPGVLHWHRLPSVLLHVLPPQQLPAQTAQPADTAVGAV